MNANFDFVAADAVKENFGILSLLRDGLFAALFEFKVRTRSLSDRFFYFSIVVMVIQLTHLPLSRQAGLSWPNGFAEAIQPLLENVSFGFYNYAEEASQLLMVVSSCVSVILMILFIVLLAYDEIVSKLNGMQAQGNAVKSTLGSLAAPATLFIRLQQTILQAPVLALLVRAARKDNMTSLPSAIVSTVSIVSSLLIVIHVLITSIFALTVIEHLPYSSKGFESKMYAAPHGRTECLATLTRAAAVISVAMLGSFDGSSPSAANQNVMIAISSCSALCLVGMYLHYLPWFNQRWNRVTIGAYSVFLWSSLCGVVAQIVDDRTDRSAFILFCVSVVFCVISVMSLSFARMQSIKVMETSKLLGSPYLLELHLRLRHLNLEHHATFTFTGEAEDDYRRVVDMCPGSPYINLTVSGLVNACSKKIIYSLNLVRQARQTALPFDLEFMLFFNNRISRAQRVQSANEVNFMEADSLISQARSSLVQTLKHTTSFWRRVAKGSFTVRDLLDYGAKVDFEANQVRVSIAKLTKLKAMSKEAVQLQAMYFQYVMNDKDTAFKILAKANSGLSSNDTQGASAVCTISGDKGNLGQILDISKGLTQLFGFSRSDLIGQNISVLCPAPFQAVHDMFLQQFMSMDNDFVPQAMRIYGMHQAGHIMLLDLDITPSINLSGDLILIGKFTVVQSKENTYLLLVDRRTQCVTGTSEGAAAALGIDEQELFTLNVQIPDLIPAFFELRAGEENPDVQISTAPNRLFKVKVKTFQYKSREKSPVTFDVNVSIVSISPSETTMGAGPHGEFYSDSEIGSDMAEHDEEASSDEDEDEDEENGDEQEQKIPLLSGGTKPPLKIGGADKRALKFRGETRETTKVVPAARKSVGFGENASQGSRKSGSKVSRGMGRSEEGTSITSSTMNGEALNIRQIQRKIARNIRTRDPKLQSFNTFGKRFMMFFFVFAVVNAFIVVSKYETFGTDASYIERTHYVGYLLTLVSTLLLYEHHSGFVISETTTELPRRFNNEALLTASVNDLKVAHTGTVTAAKVFGGGTNLENLFHEPSLLTTISGDEFRRISYNVAILEFVGHTQAYLSSDRTKCGDSCRFIINNGLYDTFNTALSVSRAFHVEGQLVLDGINEFNKIVVYVVMAILILSFMIAYAPMFASIENRKKKVGQAFLAIPETVAKKLERRSERRLQVMQSGATNWSSIDQDEVEDEDAEEEFEGGPEDGAKDSEGKEEKKVEKRLSKNRRASNSKVDPVGDDDELTKSEKNLRAAAMKKKRVTNLKKEPLFRRIVSFLFAVMRVGITFWLVLGFFLTMTLLDDGHRQTVDSLSSSVYVSGMRYVTSTALVFWSALSVFPREWERRNDELALEIMDGLLADMRVYERALKYGNDTLGVQPYTTTSGPQFKLLFEDACNQECLAYLDAALARNETAEKANDLRQGLTLATERHLSRVERIVDRLHSYLADKSNMTNYYKLQQAKADLKDIEPELMLSNQMRKSLAMDLESLSVDLLSIRTEKIIACCVFVIILGFAHLVSVRTFRMMDTELKRSQTLLLVLPESVFATVPQIVGILNEG